ncbi:MAG: hypothetical protein H0W96_02690 [Solirubrobacterales bacterium]|nr:hypothetical protein [Solirubrobacterales bacterium]
MAGHHRVLRGTFRRQIRTLLEGPIKRWKAGPFEFENEWGKAREQVGQSVPTRAALASHDDGPDDLDDLLDLAEKAPVPAILAAYQAAVAGIDGAQTASIPKLSPALVELGWIDPKTDDALAGLVTLRNLAAHGPATEGRRAREYIILSEAVLYALSQSKGARRGQTDDAR